MTERQERLVKCFPDLNKNLEILAEECAEVIQSKSKLVRFGFNHNHHVTGRQASEAWCPLARPANRLEFDQNGLVIDARNSCLGSRCAMWSISRDKDGDEIGGVCGAALTGQLLVDV